MPVTFIKLPHRQLPKKESMLPSMLVTVIGYIIGAAVFTLIWWSLFSGITEG